MGLEFINTAIIASANVQGNINYTGALVRAGTTVYPVSAFGAESGAGTLVLLSLATRTLTINGVTVNVVVNP